MLSEKSYYILLAIVIFAFIYYFKKNEEGFANKRSFIYLKYVPGPPGTKNTKPIKYQYYPIDTNGYLNLTLNSDPKKGIPNGGTYGINDNIKRIYLTDGYKAGLYLNYNYSNLAKTITGNNNWTNVPAGISSIKVYPSTTKSSTTSKVVYSGCRSQQSILNRDRNLLNSAKRYNSQLIKVYNSIKKQKDNCQGHIDRSIKNLDSVQDQALVAANKQLNTTKDALLYAEYAGKGTKQALDAQKNAADIISKDSAKSLQELKEAQDEAAKTNQIFQAEKDKYFKMINLGRLLENAETFTDLPKQPTMEYFKEHEGNWRNEWENKLRDLNITKDRLNPQDAPLHGYDNIKIPLVMNKNLEDNMNQATARSIAAQINYQAREKMLPAARRQLREISKETQK